MSSQIEQNAQTQPRLRHRVLSAGAWTIAAYGTTLFVKLFSNLILTRLLFPEAFGAIMAANALITGLALISDLGARAVVVQSRQGDQAAFLHSAWLVQVWQGVAVWVILAVVCILIAVPTVHGLLPSHSAFADPSFPLITVTLGLVVVLGGMESMSIALNARRLNYKPIVLVNLISWILSLPVTIGWAWVSPSAWALVGGTLFAGILRVILSHLALPGPWMGIKWDKNHLREIARFGRWTVVSSFGTFVSTQFDVIFLGLVMPGLALGLYSIAKLLVSTGEDLLERLNSSLALPVLSEVVRKNPKNLQSRYYQLRLPIELLAGLLSGGMFAAGSFVVSFLYDPRYAQAGFMLQILALSTALYPFLIIKSAFYAIGQIHIFATVSVLQAVSLVGCVTLGFYFFGVEGAICGVASHRIVPLVALVFLARRHDWIGIWQEFRLIPAFLVGLVTGKSMVAIASTLGLENIHQLLPLLKH